MKVSLKMLNDLVEKLNRMAEAVEISDAKSLTDESLRSEYAAQLSMAYGLAAGISVEASGVMMDFLKVLKSQGLGMASPLDMKTVAAQAGFSLEDILGKAATPAPAAVNTPTVKKENKPN